MNKRPRVWLCHIKDSTVWWTTFNPHNYEQWIKDKTLEVEEYFPAPPKEIKP